MAVRPVTYYGDPILARRCRPVTDFDQLPIVLDDMFDTMYEEEGVGLAANQIGLDLHLFIVDVTHTDEADKPFVAANAEVVESSGSDVVEEGCLSLPGIRVDVKRPTEIVLKFQDITGQEHTRKFDGFFARAIQHEMDHLNGTLIIDRVNPLIQLKFSRELKELQNRHQLQPGT